MKNSKTGFASLAALLLFGALLASCGEAAGIPAETDVHGQENDAVQSEAPAETEPAYEKDNVPDADYGGYEFHVYRKERAWYHGSWYAENETGDTLNDAMFRRNRAVEERFNVKIRETFTEGDPSDARKSIMAGDDEYDILVDGSPEAFGHLGEGLYVGASTLEYVDLSRSYWDKEVNDALSIRGEHYLLVGDAVLPDFDYVHVLVFNKDMLSANDLEDPYGLVTDGKWTVDCFAQMIKDVSRDVNGDGKMDDSDTYGYLSIPKNVLPGFWIGSGLTTITKNEKDEFVFSLADDTRFLDLFNHVFEITWDSGAWYANKESANYFEGFITMFMNGQGLFMDTTFYYISSLRGMETNFGILPYPKYDEAQQTYASRIESLEVILVPTTASDLSRTSALLEAINCESAKTLVPAYYDIALKGKSTRDEESVAMLDIIFDTRTADLGDATWFGALRDGIFATMFMSNKRDLSSKLASTQKKVDTAISKVLDSLG